MFLWVSLSVGIEYALNLVGHFVVPVTTVIMNIHSTIAGELINLTVIGGEDILSTIDKSKKRKMNSFSYI